MKTFYIFILTTFLFSGARADLHLKWENGSTNTIYIRGMDNGFVDTSLTYDYALPAGGIFEFVTDQYSGYNPSFFTSDNCCDPIDAFDIDGTDVIWTFDDGYFYHVLIPLDPSASGSYLSQFLLPMDPVDAFTWGFSIGSVWFLFGLAVRLLAQLGKSSGEI